MTPRPEDDEPKPGGAPDPDLDREMILADLIGGEIDVDSPSGQDLLASLSMSRQEFDRFARVAAALEFDALTAAADAEGADDVLEGERVHEILAEAMQGSPPRGSETVAPPKPSDAPYPQDTGGDGTVLRPKWQRWVPTIAALAAAAVLAIVLSKPGDQPTPDAFDFGDLAGKLLGGVTPEEIGTAFIDSANETITIEGATIRARERLTVVVYRLSAENEWIELFSDDNSQATIEIDAADFELLSREDMLGVTYSIGRRNMPGGPKESVAEVRWR